MALGKACVDIGRSLFVTLCLRLNSFEVVTDSLSNIAETYLSQDLQ